MGQILSLLSGMFFGGSNVFTRRGVFHAQESFSALPITVAIGTLLFFMTVLIAGDTGRLAYLSWIGILSLGGAGIVHFVIGRAFNYASLGLIGANRTEPLLATNILFAVAFGLIFLDESLTFLHAVGIGAVFLGVVLIGTSREGFGKGKTLTKATVLKGVGAGLLAGFCYGVSSLLIKVGFREAGSPLAGGLISHIAAALMVGFFLIDGEHRAQLSRLSGAAFISIAFGGTLLALGQIFRYLALGLVPINIVAPLTATANLFVPIFSFLINRKMEVFSAKVLGGSIAVIAGVYIILLF
jgi:drug/metabolite transporter (DMT)-like permease